MVDAVIVVGARLRTAPPKPPDPPAPPKWVGSASLAPPMPPVPAVFPVRVELRIVSVSPAAIAGADRAAGAAAAARLAEAACGAAVAAISGVVCRRRDAVERQRARGADGS